MSRHSLPELPFAIDALEPKISAETLAFHHGKHHAGYVNKLNAQLDGSGNPATGLAQALADAFGSLDAFRDRFKLAATANFGSGWTWLVRNPAGELDIVNTDDADNPLRVGSTPLMTCDVWEHAYYIDYRNARGDYVDAFFDLLNWDFVARNLDAAQHG